MSTTAESLITDHLDLWSSTIKAKKTTGRGSKKKQDLYGIKKLRELILELAVRGMLVPQSPNDEPASESLKKIEARRSELIKNELLKKQKKLSVISNEEIPFTLPKTWEWIRLGNATNYGIFDKIEADEVKNDTWVLELEDVEKSTSKLLKKVRFKDRNFKSSKNSFVKSDVLYGKLRPYLDKVLIADESGVCTTEMIPITAYSSLSSSFLRISLKSPNFKSYANSSTHGMNLPRMGTDKARDAIIPLPPLAEQHRIVAKVDELMALCDQLEQQQEDSLQTHQTLVKKLLEALTTACEQGQFDQAWQRIATNFDTLFTTESSIDQLKQIILQLAVMGKLVENEDSWDTGSLKNIADAIVDCPHSTPKWTEDGEICIRTNQFHPGYLNLNNTRFVSAETYKERIQRLEPRAGDILYSREGGILGIACRVPPDTKLCLGQRMMLIRPSELTAPEFLELVLNSPLITEIARKKTTGGAAPRVNVSTVKAYPIPLPPIAEQHRIVAKVDELMTLCDQLKTNLQKSQETQLNLTVSLAQV